MPQNGAAITGAIGRAAGDEMSADKAELFMHYWNMLSKLPAPKSEYNFDKHLGRKHRFDFAFPEHLIAIEIEGNAWNVKGGGRHMQNSDLEKYNIAASLGWRIFRFSPSMIKSDPAGCIQTIVEAVCLTKTSSGSVAVISASVDVDEAVKTHITPLSITSNTLERAGIPNSTTTGILSSSITMNTSKENLTPEHGDRRSGKSRSKDTASRQ